MQLNLGDLVQMRKTHPCGRCRSCRHPCLRHVCGLFDLFIFYDNFLGFFGIIDAKLHFFCEFIPLRSRDFLEGVYLANNELSVDQDAIFG